VGQNTSRLKYTDFFHKISKSGYGTNYMGFFMSFLYSKYMKKKLYLCDTTSNISESFHLILDTFEANSVITYTNKRGFTIFEDKIIDLKKYLETLTHTFLCAEARSLFRLNSKTQTHISSLISAARFPNLDVGIHIRMGDKITTGEMKEISLNVYINAIRETGGRNIYIMTDNIAVIDKIKEAEPIWSIYSLPSPVPLLGHLQREYNSRTTSDKIAAYYHFLAELHIIQRCPAIICTYSSNIGRFLYLTKEATSTIKSLDVPEFAIVEDLQYRGVAPTRPSS